MDATVRKRSIRKFSLLACFLVGCSVAAAQDGTFVVYGPVTSSGTISCATWADAVYAQRDVYEWWVLGFVSGAGYKSPPLAHTDSAAIRAWMTKYCADNPLDDIAKAAMVLVSELRTRAQQQ